MYIFKKFYELQDIIPPVGVAIVFFVSMGCYVLGG